MDVCKGVVSARVEARIESLRKRKETKDGHRILSSVFYLAFICVYLRLILPLDGIILTGQDFAGFRKLSILKIQIVECDAGKLRNVGQVLFDLSPSLFAFGSKFLVFNFRSRIEPFGFCLRIGNVL